MKFLAIIFFLASCGSEPKTETVETIKYVTVETEVPVGRETHEIYATAVNDKSDLPPCELENDQQLIYVKFMENFYICEKSEWHSIGIKGEKGDPGTPATANVWFDPMTNRQWLIGGYMTDDEIDSLGYPCENDWLMPIESTALAAVQHGLLLASISMDGPDMIWLAKDVTGERPAMDQFGDLYYRDEIENAAIFCTTKKGD